MKEIYENAIKPMLPTIFDENEWFTIAITILVTISLYYITVMNRKLLWSEIICISLFNLQMTTIGDYFLAMPPYDFYDTVDKNSGEIADIFLQNIVYPGTVLIFMDFYKRFNLNKVVFIVVGVFLLSGLEGISVHFFHLFTYKTWKFYYSILFYLLVMVTNLVFYEKLTTYIEKRISTRETNRNNCKKGLD